MRTFKLCLIMIFIIAFTGCSNKEPEVITRTEIQEVYIPVKPLRSKINCEFKGTGNEPIAKMLDCIIIQKRVIENLTQDKYE